MSSGLQQQDLAGLISRLSRLRPDTPRAWGSMSPAELLCHLADAADYVLGRRIPANVAVAGRFGGLVKWIALYAPLPWPKGKIVTQAWEDPRREGSRPGDFERDRERVIEGLRALAAPETALASRHTDFGAMSRADWHRWAWRHVDHHLRQFGL